MVESNFTRMDCYNVKQGPDKSNIHTIMIDLFQYTHEMHVRDENRSENEIIRIYMQLCSIEIGDENNHLSEIERAKMKKEKAKKYCREQGYKKIFEFELSYIYLLFKLLKEYRENIISMTEEITKNRLQIESLKEAIIVKRKANALLVAKKDNKPMKIGTITANVGQFQTAKKIKNNVQVKEFVADAEDYTDYARKYFIIEFVKCGILVVNNIYFQYHENFKPIIAKDEFRRLIRES
jgi:hypothetical protein